MSEIKTEAVTVTIADNILDGPAGAIKFYKTSEHDPAGFHFQCPCGCWTLGGVNVAPGHPS